MWWRGKRDGQPSDDGGGLGTGVGDECEAFLAGRLARYLGAAGQPVPPVGWLNQVAHGTPAELSALARTSSMGTPPPSRWARTVGYLARSLLERSRETCRTIEELQRELLVPLELELIAMPECADLDPADIVRITLARLYELPELWA